MKIYPIYDDDTGLLAVMPHPSSGDLLQSQLDYLAKCNFDIVVSLLTKNEEQELGLERERETAIELGMEFVSFPINDMSNPEDMSSFYGLATKIATQIEEEQRVVVHCRAGVGRSGLLSAAILVVLGLNAEDAFDLVTRARGEVVPETSEQSEWFFEDYLPYVESDKR